MFYLSRAVVELVAPFPLSVVLLVLAFLLLVIRKVRLGALCLALALFLQIFFGYGFLVRERIAGIEALYPAITEAGLVELKAKQVKYIVVLGSGHVSDSRLSSVSQLGGSSLYRLVEGIRLLQLKPDARLVVSGGIGYDPVANAEVVGRVAESIGVAKERIIIEKRPRDTLQEAEMLFPLLGQDAFVLVTSAMHMPRAMKIFQDRGMRPIAAPTDYVMKREVVEPPGRLFPTTFNLDLSRRILYEWLAEQWLFIKKSVEKFSR
ncbi:MAG: YdcF family protein [Proteobacteria bacterium]|nr:YdcF family protein [Pseudomonadota bacterium]